MCVFACVLRLFVCAALFCRLHQRSNTPASFPLAHNTKQHNTKTRKKNKQTLDGFLAAKARLDERGDSPDVPLSELMGVAHAATTLRALLLRALSSGLRNDAPDAALAMRQRFRLGELRCEEYVFVLLSRFVNALEREGGATALAAARSSIAWSHPLAVLLLGVRNLGLGGWMPAECMAIENEVTVWQQEASYDERDNALRCAFYGIE